jgi:hypothetical protein
VRVSIRARRPDINIVFVNARHFNLQGDFVFVFVGSTVVNGSPGLDQLRINVNGTDFESGRLKDGQTATVNIGRAMNRGSDNTITFEFRGQPGDSAWIVIRPANED